MKLFFVLTCALFVSLLFSSCTASQEQKPPEISYGFDVCEQCRMSIDHPEFSAAFTTSIGDVRKFDDIGCMIKFMHKHESIAADFVYAANYNTKLLIDGEKAFFVRTKKVATPMGYGIIAFENESSARTFPIQQSDQILSYDEVRKILRTETKTNRPEAVKK